MYEIKCAVMQSKEQKHRTSLTFKKNMCVSCFLHKQNIVSFNKLILFQKHNFSKSLN